MFAVRSRLLAAALVAAIATPVSAHAAGGRPPALQGADTLLAGADSTAEAPDSPRATVREFLTLTGRGDYARAARLLALDARTRNRGPELARRLRAVMDRWVLVELDAVSPLADGNVADGEPPLQDRIGVPMRSAPDEAAEPIVLVKVRQGGGEARWLFSRGTVGSINDAYAALDSSWTRGRLPESLLRGGPLGVPLWKWLGMLGGIPLVWLAAWAAAGALRRAAVPVARRSRAHWLEALLVRLRAPLALAAAALLGAGLVYLLEFNVSTSAALWRLLRVTGTAALFWGVVRAVAFTERQLAEPGRGADRTHTKTIVPLLGRSLRVAIVALGVLVAVAQLGYPVGTLIAGLGIGGIAVALAAQKTVENLFGSVSLAADRVFRVGDWVTIDGVSGTVETIGLRSTHLRTLDRTLVKFPNGRLADLRVESFGERDRFRFRTILRLAYGTSAGQLRRVIAEVEGVLRAHPLVTHEAVVVRLGEIATYSFDVTVQTWIRTTDNTTFEIQRQELLLGIIDAVERSGTRLAVPAQAVVDGGEPRSVEAGPTLRRTGS